MKKLSYLFLLIYILLFTHLTFAQDALYKIEFISNWSSTTHPIDYPISSAHWSPLIGTTHKDATPFLQIGLLASDGVEQVAETGATTIITQEINALIATGNAYEVINGSGLGSGLGTITLDDVGVEVGFPYITLMTMIAPSPDWIAQVNNLKLTDAGNNWLSSISVDVYATDAGTDSGITYTSGNADTTPPENMRNLENIIPFSDQIVGTFVFTLQQVLSVEDNILKDSVSIYPNPNEGIIHIDNYGNSNLISVEIYAINGDRVKIFNEMNNQNRLEFHSIKSGLYFLKLNLDNASIIKKIILK